MLDIESIADFLELHKLPLRELRLSELEWLTDGDLESLAELSLAELEIFGLEEMTTSLRLG